MPLYPVPDRAPRGIGAPIPDPAPSPGFSDVIGDALATESPVIAPFYSEAPGRAQRISEDYSAFDEPLPDVAGSVVNRLVYSQSPEETQAILREAKRYQMAQERVASAGWQGFMANLAAGMVDPTIALPGGAIIRGARGGVSIARTAAAAAALNAGGAAIAEGVLGAVQPARTREEQLAGVASAAVLAGALGGAVGAFARRSARRAAGYEVAPEIDAQNERAAAAINVEMASRLEAAGMEAEVARSEAAVLGAFYRSMSARTGRTVDELVKASPLPEVRLGAAPARVDGDGVAYNQSGENLGYIVAYHGSRHDFDRFSLEKIGTGEGAQAYGYGLYFAENEGVARWYRAAGLGGRSSALDDTVTEFVLSAGNVKDLRGAEFDAAYDRAVVNFKNELGDFRGDDRIKDMVRRWLETEDDDLLEDISDAINTRLRDAGRMYEVRINADPNDFIDLDAALSKQPDRARKVLYEWARGLGRDPENTSAAQVMGLAKTPSGAQVLREAGIPGIKYSDAGSRYNPATLPDNPIANEARKFLDMAGGDAAQAKKLFNDSDPVLRFATTERDEVEKVIDAAARKITRNYVVFDDSLIDIARKYYQGPRGSITLPSAPGAAPIITLMRGADASTFLHEAGHLFLHMMRQMADASPELKADVDAIENWWRTNAEAVASDANRAGTGGELRQGAPDIYTGSADDLADLLAEIDRALGEYPYVGLRTSEDRFDPNAPSRIWVDGEPTEDLLNGFSATDVDRSLDLALRVHRLGNEGPRVGEGYYYGDHVTLLGSRVAQYGEDQGELIMEAPVAIREWVRGGKFNQGGPSGGGPTVTADDVRAFLDNGTTGDRAKDAAVNVGMQEQWARGFEAYLIEGRAPTAELQGVFERFKQWLLDIYESAKALNVEMTPEIRGVMDRMLASDRQAAWKAETSRMAREWTGDSTAGAASRDTLSEAALRDMASGKAPRDFNAVRTRSAEFVVKSNRLIGDPVAALMTSPSTAARRIVRGLVETPVMTEGQAAGFADAGLSVETAIKRWQGNLAAGMKMVETEFLASRGITAGTSDARRELQVVGRQARDRIGGVETGTFTWTQFKTEVATAMRNGDQHANPHVAKAAKAMRENVYAPLRDEAIARGLLPEDVAGAAEADQYLNRIYQVDRIVKERPRFVRMATDWLMGEQAKKAAIQEDVARLDDERRIAETELRKAQRRAETATKRVRDVEQRIAEQAIAERRNLSREDWLKERVAAIDAEIADTQARIDELRQDAAANRDEIDALTADIRDLEQAKKIEPDAEDLAGIAQGLREDRDAANTDREALREAVSAAVAERRRTQARRVAPAARASERSMEANAQRRRSDVLLDRLIRAEDQAAALDAVVARREADVGSARERLEDAVLRWEGHSTDEAKAAVKARMKAEDARTQRLQAEGRDPAEAPRMRAADKAIDKAVKRILGAPTDLERQELEDIANQIADRIISTPDGRLPYDQMEGKNGQGFTPQNKPGGLRGPMKARVWAIPDDYRAADGTRFSDFLESDIEMAAHAYVRTMAPDVEIAAKFGAPEPGSDRWMESQIREIEIEYDRKMAEAPEGSAQKTLQDQKDRDIKALAGIRDRLRHTYAVRANPTSWMLRAQDVVLMWNMMRLLGGMTISAFPDAFRVVMQNGFSRAGLGGPLMAMAGDARKMAKAELQAGGTALDIMMSSRIMSIADFDLHYHRLSKFERGVQGAAAVFGKMSLMNYWNQAMKEYAGMVTLARMTPAIRDLAAGKQIMPSDRAKLAQMGIDGPMADRMAREMAAHGKDIDGVFMPNTLAWADQEAARHLRGALAAEVDRIIVSPGQERPLWMSRDGWRMVGQFRSFMVSAQQRVLASALQQRDRYVVMGLIGMVGMGALAYAIKQKLRGQEVTDNPAQLMAEALDQSGVSGWLFDVNNIMEKVTQGRIGLSQLTGEQISRFASRNAVGAMLGPSLGTATDALDVIRAITHPEDFSASDLHRIRKLLPAQNLFYFRNLLNGIEEGVADSLSLPDRRRAA